MSRSSIQFFAFVLTFCFFVSAVSIGAADAARRPGEVGNEVGLVYLKTQTGLIRTTEGRAGQNQKTRAADHALVVAQASTREERMKAFLPPTDVPDPDADPSDLSEHDRDNLARVDKARQEVMAFIAEAKSAIEGQVSFTVSRNVLQPILDAEDAIRALDARRKAAEAEYDKWVPEAAALRAELKQNPISENERQAAFEAMSKDAGNDPDGDGYVHRSRARDAVKAEDWCGFEGNSHYCATDFTADGQFIGYRPGPYGLLAAAQARVESSREILTGELRDDYERLRFEVNRQHGDALYAVKRHREERARARSREQKLAERERLELERAAEQRKLEAAAEAKRVEDKKQYLAQQAAQTASLREEYDRETIRVASLNLSRFDQHDVDVLRMFHRGDDREIGQYYDWERDGADEFIARYAIDLAKFCGVMSETVREFTPGTTEYDLHVSGLLGGTNDYTTARKNPDQVRAFQVPLGFKKLILKTQIGFNYGPSFKGIINAIGGCESPNPMRILDNMGAFFNSTEPFAPLKFDALPQFD